MYYPSKARDIALSNNHNYHLVAWAKRGSSYVYGTNSDRCSVHFERTHPDGTKGFHLHAEMALLKKLRPGTVREIRVARFLKNGNTTMAKPCEYCRRFLREHGVRRVYYTNWKGGWDLMRL